MEGLLQGPLRIRIAVTNGSAPSPPLPPRSAVPPPLLRSPVQEEADTVVAALGWVDPALGPGPAGGGVRSQDSGGRQCFEGMVFSIWISPSACRLLLAKLYKIRPLQSEYISLSCYLLIWRFIIFINQWDEVVFPGSAHHPPMETHTSKIPTPRPTVLGAIRARGRWLVMEVVKAADSDAQLDKRVRPFSLFPP